MMKKNKNIFLILAVLSLSACSVLNPDIILEKNEEKLEVFAGEFLDQDQIMNLTNRKGKNKCNIVNQWSSCPSSDFIWSNSTNNLRMEELEDVLDHDGISIDYYNNVIDFLDMYGFKSIGKDDSQMIVDFGHGLDGLIYTSNTELKLDEDYNRNLYNFIIKLNYNWYSYSYDWN